MTAAMKDCSKSAPALTMSSGSRTVPCGAGRNVIPVVPVSRNSHEEHHPAVVAADGVQPCLGDARHALEPCNDLLVAFGKCIAGVESDRLPDRSLGNAAEPVDLDEPNRRRCVLSTSTAARHSAARIASP
jgi:hypothetical protein